MPDGSNCQLSGFSTGKTNAEPSQTSASDPLF